MAKQISLEKTVEIARLYNRIRELSKCIPSLNEFIPKDVRIAKTLLRLIDKYQTEVPPEIKRRLRINKNYLESLCIGKIYPMC